MYPCQLFLRYKRQILSWECWNFWRRHDHFRRFPKKSEVFRNLRRPINASSLPECFSLQKSEIARKVLSFIHFSHVFHSLHGSELRYFGNCVKQDGSRSHFSIRREKLTRRHEPAWDRSFQPAWDSRLRHESWQVYTFITHPLIFEWFYWLLYVTWYTFSGQLSRNNPRPSRYLSSDCSVEEKHSQHKNFNFSFVLLSMQGNQTSVIKSSDGDIKKLMASAVPESTKRSLKYAVNDFEGGESHEWTFNI